MSIEYKKVHSAYKVVMPKGPELTAKILSTMKIISDVVGSTLGPAGQPVLIERREHDIPPTVTKDGVTVFKSIGFRDPVAQCVAETGRDAAVRTVTEAGDGTTTATVLAEAIIRLSQEYCAQNPKAKPQLVARRLEQLFLDVIEPTLRKASIKASLDKRAGRKLLHAVAKLSANGDGPLADAVLQCFDICGDAGNVTITEQSGPSHYEVEKVEGYPIRIGYDDCAGIFAPKFVNDPGRQLCAMNNPVFLLYNGSISNPMELLIALERVGERFVAALNGQGDGRPTPNAIVVVAAGFSEVVLASFAASWDMANAVKVFPLVVPRSIIANYQAEFLGDLAAITGATVFDPLNRPLDTATFEDFGPGVDGFEAGRFRSTILGTAAARGTDWENALLDRVSVVQQQVEGAGSQLDRIMLEERLAKLTGGIARLKVIGSSNGELKEKRDRAEDAVCAVRGAIKQGCLPGGGWGLIRAAIAVMAAAGDDPVVREILVPALGDPVDRLLHNCGKTEEEVDTITKAIWDAAVNGTSRWVYDAMNDVYGDAKKLGVLDSAPAVIEAIRNSISMAGTLGTMGGVVVFARDEALETTEARDVQAWQRDAGTNPADERP